MKITRIAGYALPFRFIGGGYRTSYGTRTHLDNLLLVLETDRGLTGYGEVARLTGAAPRPTDPDRVQLLAGRAQQVLGADPGSPQPVRDRLGALAPGGTGIACAFDTACLDILAKGARLPLASLLGGTVQAAIATYASVGQGDPAAMAAEAAEAVGQGYGVIQMKVGGDPAEDLARVAAVLQVLRPDQRLLPDANGGWTLDQAVAVLSRLADPRILWEEPCRTYAENKALAAKTGARLVLDQCLGTLADYARLCTEGFAAGAGLKPAIQGGLSAARAARDLCITHGLPLKIDDSWGADVTTSGALHLALGVPESLLLAGVDMRPFFVERLDAAGPRGGAATLAPAAGFGLGVTPALDRLGPPLFRIE